MDNLPIYKLHPAVGIARVGDSPEQIYLAPETTGDLPIDSDPDGNPVRGEDGTEKTTSTFKDSEGRVKRQGARFKVFVYDRESPNGRELKRDNEVVGPEAKGKLVDIEWTVWLANKKAVWYQFQELAGERGYAPRHPLRDAKVTDPNARQALIVDPGPHTVDFRTKRRASFSRDGNQDYAPTFPPPLQPFDVDTLGDLLVNASGNLVVLGGHGCSGTCKTGLGQPRIDYYAQTDGWFDDVSDGPVTAKLVFWNERDRMFKYLPVHEPAWVLVGYPAYAPQIADMVTMDDVVYDVAVREFAYDTFLYGLPPFDPAGVDADNPQQLQAWRRNDNRRYNPSYYPLFFKEIWPILERPTYMQWVTSLLAQSFDAHGTKEPKENFYQTAMETPPKDGEDPYWAKRNYVYNQLRQPGQENHFKKLDGDPDSPNYGQPLMPLLNGDNPLSNTVPSKFLRLTDTQLFILEQWAKGRFINEKTAGIDEQELTRSPGVDIDRGVLSNLLGGAFCPGGEVGWIMRNTAIWAKAYRIDINPDYIPDRTARGRALGRNYYSFSNPLSQGGDISAGLEPGDLTKYMALPWQADFNECSDQTVDITYRDWNKLYPVFTADDGVGKGSTVNVTLWWPAHRPMQVWAKEIKSSGKPGYMQRDWARGIPQTKAGDLKMVAAWKDLGFVAKPSPSDKGAPAFIEVERNPEQDD